MTATTHTALPHDFVVETSGLTKRFGDRFAVDSVDLRIPRGVAFGYLGPNGAGKTTLIRMLLGLTPASSGTMRLLGRPVPERAGEASPALAPSSRSRASTAYLTGRENLEIVAAAREPEAHRRIDGALARVGLADRADEQVERYSLGMRQRLGVARSLLADPELLILDEPTNGLDPAGILEFRDMVRALVDEGRTVVLSSTCSTRWRRSATPSPSSTTAASSCRARSPSSPQSAATTILLGASDTERAHARSPPRTRGRHRRGRARRAPPHAGGRLAPTRRPSRTCNRRLVEAGVGVHRIETERVSLEDRFLQITSRLGETP